MSTFSFNSRLGALLFLLLIITWAQSPCQAQEANEPLKIPQEFQSAVLLKMRQEQAIDSGLVSVIEQEIAKYNDTSERLAIILEIDSGGGPVDAARELVALVQEYVEHDAIRVFAYIPRQALSAAAWVAMGCEGLIMAPDALIGDIQPIVGSFQGYERVPEKIVTVIREEVRGAVRKNGLPRTQRYPELFVDAMVDKNIEIVRITNTRLQETHYLRAIDFDALSDNDRKGLARHTIVDGSMTLTASGADLAEYGFGIAVIDGHEALRAAFGGADLNWTVVQLDPPSRFGPIELDWSWLLVLLGITFIALEFKAPGLGAFGLVGILALAGFFLLQSGFDDSALVPIMLLLVGAFLIIVEAVFIPGFGLAGGGGFVIILYATYAAVAPSDAMFPWPDFSDEVQKSSVTTWALFMSGALVGGVVTSVVLGRQLLRLPLLRNLVLVPSMSTQPAEGSSRFTAQAVTPTGTTRVSVGQGGHAFADLRPAGIAIINGKKVDVVAQGQYVEKDAPIVVVEVAGNRCVVREVKKS